MLVRGLKIPFIFVSTIDMQRNKVVFLVTALWNEILATLAFLFLNIENNYWDKLLLLAPSL